MAVYDTSKCTVLIREAFNHIADNTDGSMELQRANGDYIVSHYEEWLDELEKYNEHLLVHPDAKHGAELAFLYAYFAYICAANGCLQNAYVIYMLGSDVVEKYGNSRDQKTFCDAGAFCPKHFGTTPQSFDQYFLDLMKQRAKGFIVRLASMLDESCQIKRECSAGMDVKIYELHKRARIFEAYATTEGMTQYPQDFYPLLADINLCLADVSYAVFGFGDYCKECLDKALQYAKRTNDEDKVKIIEGNISWLLSLNKDNVQEQESALKNPEKFLEACHLAFRDIADKRGLAIAKAMQEPNFIELGKKMALKILQDKSITKEAGDDLSFYYISVMVGCLQAGIAAGYKIEDGFDKLNAYVEMLADKGNRLNAAAPIIAGELKLSSSDFQSLSLELFAKWQQLHKPYFELKDHRMHTLNSMAAAFLLGVEMITAKN